MRRSDRLMLVGLVALAGCGSTRTTTVTVGETVRTVTVRQRAADAPRTADPPKIARSQRSSTPSLAYLVPPDASVQNAWNLPAAGGVPEQIAVTWKRQAYSDDYPEHALVIWERSRPGTVWRPIHVLSDYRYAQKVNVYSIGVQLADVTGDGHLDVLVRQDTGGTALCGDYDLLATAAGRVRAIFSADECYDDTAIALRPGELVIDRGFQYAPGGEHIHPVFRTWRRTVKRWDGRRFRTVRRQVIAPSEVLAHPYGRDG